LKVCRFLGAYDYTISNECRKVVNLRSALVHALV